MKALKLYQAVDTVDALQLELAECTPPALKPGQLLIEVNSAAVNPSDVKAALGLMPHAVWPRVPGRDYAGTVLEGPAEWLGKQVWGSGGELGIRRDGSHAKYLVVDEAGVREKPAAVPLLEAGGVGVPFVTAYEGLRRAGLSGDTRSVLVLGANGKVGQAAIQLASAQGVKVIAVTRNGEAYQGHANGQVELIDASTTPVAERVRECTDGRGADIVFNTVGSPYFDAGNASMAKGATQIFISTLERSVPFDIFTFYRGQHTYVGIDTLALDHVGCAAIFDALADGFAREVLRPFPVKPGFVYPLAQAHDAYRQVAAGARERVVLTP
ncbi:oxidoreductase [Burkholderia sp. SRS-W-2-2016]|uniref:quinone oxidoreductase family protein n=1 Tax=Burkholderia sp. SRS-W-2-2016 TaxID=1926878 RepID=UPI00094B592F|nr:zinc-binding alcohol dehydrogenase family protein [Burkholderia sp. SRS-W-2-2016]OLL32303.1 oxidoreductase [Burkholderia sp. SRS-W-2-2016]